MAQKYFVYLGEAAALHSPLHFEGLPTRKPLAGTGGRRARPGGRRAGAGGPTGSPLAKRASGHNFAGGFHFAGGLLTCRWILSLLLDFQTPTKSGHIYKRRRKHRRAVVAVMVAVAVAATATTTASTARMCLRLRLWRCVWICFWIHFLNICFCCWLLLEHFFNLVCLFCCVHFLRICVGLVFVSIS